MQSDLCPFCGKELVEAVDVGPDGKESHWVYCLNRESYLDLMTWGASADTKAEALNALAQEFRQWKAREQTAGETTE